MRDHGWGLKPVYHHFIPPADDHVEVSHKKCIYVHQNQKRKKQEYGSERRIQCSEEENKKKKVIRSYT
jgi:hypothetical protein